MEEGKKLLEVSSGRGFTDVSFPDIFTVLAESPRCGHGQNVTSSSKPEHTEQSGYVFTSGVMDYEVEDVLPLVSYNNSAVCLSGGLIHCVSNIFMQFKPINLLLNVLA